MKKSSFIYTSILVALAFCNQQCHVEGACGSIAHNDYPIEGDYIGTHSVDTAVNKLQQQRKYALLYDSLAEQAYQKIDDILKTGKSVRLFQYQFRSERAESYAELYGYDHIDYEDGEIISQKNNWKCTWNENSLYEECHDTELFLNTEGVDESELQPDEFYIDKAWDVLDKRFKLPDSDHYQFYLYKMKRLMMSSYDPDTDKVTEKVEHVGVGFAMTMDGWPVIGFGGKAGVYMMPDGTSVSETVYRKTPTAFDRDSHELHYDVITEQDLKTPEEALAELSETEELNLSEYDIIRHEFGYLTFGKTNIQNVLAPYYVFFIQPKPDGDPEISSGMVEIYEVLAVKGDKASAAKADAQREDKRIEDELNEIENQFGGE